MKNIEQEALDHVINVIKGLQLTNGEFLLAVAWVTIKSKLYHKKFPFLLGADETFRTNTEKRALARLVGKTMDNHIIPFVNVFIPSRQEWVFDWLWGTAYVWLLDDIALTKTSVVQVDQDERNWNAMKSNMSPYRECYGEAMGRLCFWHKVCFHLAVPIVPSFTSNIFSQSSCAHAHIYDLSPKVCLFIPYLFTKIKLRHTTWVTTDKCDQKIMVSEMVS